MRLPNSYGGVVKLGGNRRKPFGARLTIGRTEEGKQIYKYIGYYEKRADALLALAEYHKQPYSLDNVNITFEEIYQQWADARYPELSTSSVKNYKSSFKNCVAVHKMPIKQIKAAHLQSIFDNSTLAHDTQKQVRTLLKQVFTYAMSNDIILKDYSSYIKLKKTPSKPARRIFTEKEINTLWQNKNLLYADTVLIMIYTGLRIGELLDITTDNVHIDKRYMVGGKKTKAGIDRIIPLNEKIVPLIEKRLADNGKYLILSKRGKKVHYNYYNGTSWADIMTALNMKHTPHDCRATFASLIDRTDANKLSIKRILGHANGNITEHYVQKDINDLITAVNKI